MASVFLTRHHLDNDEVLHRINQVGAELIQVIAFLSADANEQKLGAVRRNQVSKGGFRYRETFNDGVGFIDTDEFHICGFQRVQGRA